MLSGGHPNSLGRTLEVVELVLKNEDRFDALFQCYFSNDHIVRLRTSNALKRIEKQQHHLLIPYIDRLLSEVSKINQPSTQWTLANLFLTLADDMTDIQRSAATVVMQSNLTHSHDWIVLNETMRTLAIWSSTNKGLRDWLLPHLTRLSLDPRKSVSKRARKLLNELAS